jgi:asparagine synthase (glutamine-hydrolysing)
MSAERLERMADAQHHRGPDDRGVFVDAMQGIGLAHNRLSIVDLSAAGHQPMSDSTGTRAIVFNGEIYNYRELATELEGYPFRSATDTEVILAAYDRWGDACVERFNGMFAFALWDGRRRRLFCARDRLGVKPFHYTSHRGQFLFASEVKALLAAGVSAAPDWTSWGTYLAHGTYDHDERTFFEQIRSLPAGASLVIEDGRLQIRHYWDLFAQSRAQFDGTLDEACREFRDLLTDSVRLRLRADVPVGINLSGGLDSACMLAAADDALHGQGEIRAFTASFDDPQYDETGFADRVLRFTKLSRRTSRLGPEDVWNDAIHAMWHQEAPFGGIGTLAYQAVHGLAKKEGVTVLLEGQGVDELLAGYSYFRPAYHLDLLEHGNCATFRRELRAGGNVSDGVAAIRDECDPHSPALYQDRTTFLRPDLVTQDIIAKAGPAPRFREPFPHRLSNRLYRDLRHTKLPRVLRMNDRLSMAFSLELRQPYLDYRLVELAFRLASDLKIRNGIGKYLLRHVFSDRLPDDVIWTAKRPVVTPQREWMRGPLAGMVEELIESRAFQQRGIFDPHMVRRAFDRFKAGEGENGFFVWQWINTELWFRRFIDTAAAQPNSSYLDDAKPLRGEAVRSI